MFLDSLFRPSTYFTANRLVDNDSASDFYFACLLFLFGLMIPEGTLVALIWGHRMTRKESCSHMLYLYFLWTFIGFTPVVKTHPPHGPALIKGDLVEGLISFVKLGPCGIYSAQPYLVWKIPDATCNRYNRTFVAPCRQQCRCFNLYLQATSRSYCLSATPPSPSSTHLILCCSYSCLSTSAAHLPLWGTLLYNQMVKNCGAYGTRPEIRTLSVAAPANSTWK